MLSIPNRAGIGLRHPHLQQMLDEKPDIAWLEVHSENFFGHGPHTKQLDTIKQEYPLSLHGVALSLGSDDPINKDHLKLLKTAIDRYQPHFISDHLSWGSIDGQYFNDLLPLPYTEESLANFVDKIKQTQDYLNHQILIENPSSYLRHETSTIPEWEFFAELPKLTGCGLLLDVNNIYVSNKNFNSTSESYLNSINKNDVHEIHLAGHTINHYEKGDIYIDDHGSKVCDDVWDLYEETIKQIGPRPTLIEWDSNIPALSVLLDEAKLAQNILDKY